MIRDSFRSIISYKIPEEVNEILYCSSSSSSALEPQDGKPQKGKSKTDMKHQNPMVQSFKMVNDHIRKIRSFKQDDNNRDKLSTEGDFLELDSIMKSLRVV